MEDLELPVDMLRMEKSHYSELLVGWIVSRITSWGRASR